jgi:hypothetical protein
MRRSPCSRATPSSARARQQPGLWCVWWPEGVRRAPPQAARMRACMGTSTHSRVCVCVTARTTHTPAPPRTRVLVLHKLAAAVDGLKGQAVDVKGVARVVVEPHLVRRRLLARRQHLARLQRHLLCVVVCVCVCVVLWGGDFLWGGGVLKRPRGAARDTHGTHAHAPSTQSPHAAHHHHALTNHPAPPHPPHTPPTHTVTRSRQASPSAPG